jgi:hypothetical protein
VTIRVVDDGVYEEQLLIADPVHYRGIVLESAGKATLRKLPNKSESVWIRSVSGVTVRGFHFESTPGRHSQVVVTGVCPGVVLERLDMTANADGECIGVQSSLPANAGAPLVIQDCNLRGGKAGIILEGRARDNIDRSIPCGMVVIRRCLFAELGNAINLVGAVHNTQVVGNRFLDTRYGAIDLLDPSPVTANVLIANNTMFLTNTALRIWDDSSKGKDFLKSKNIRVVNNLVLAPPLPADFIFQDHPRGSFRGNKPGDMQALLKSPEWCFSHNWREIAPPRPGTFAADVWIPARPNDRLQVPLEVRSREPGHPNFLRPPKDSPLANGGAGVDDPALPRYVGAVPPEGVPPWDWDKTWKALVR